MSKYARYILLILLAALSAGCVLTREDYKPAGFDSWQDVLQYSKDYSYYATRLSQDEWQAYYRRFPDYWKDLEHARRFGSTMQYHPTYTAYAFRWTTLQRKGKWDAAAIARLENKQIQAGDDVFQVIWALGPPERVLYNNYFEVLLYLGDTALIMDSGRFRERKSCKDCYIYFDSSSGRGFEEKQVEEKLGLVRPKY